MTTSHSRPWIGVDLDGTLAVYDGWKGIDHIGEPVPAVLAYVKELFVAGIEVRIFTARCQEGPEAVYHIQRWCLKHLGYVVPVTDKKDFSMVALIDDRACAVEKNMGKPCCNPFPTVESINWHYSPANPDNPDYAECNMSIWPSEKSGGISTQRNVFREQLEQAQILSDKITRIEEKPRGMQASKDSLPTSRQERKEIPIVSGVLDYFPGAIAEVAKVSLEGNNQHNPGEPLHWARGKSSDHADCIARHLVDRGKFDKDGQRHSAKVAWRALALLQEELEAEGQVAGRASRFPSIKMPTNLKPPYGTLCK